MLPSLIIEKGILIIPNKNIIPFVFKVLNIVLI